MKSPLKQTTERHVAQTVGVDHGLAALELLGVELLERDRAPLGGERHRVPVDREHIRVAGQRPEAVIRGGLGVPVDGRVLT